MFLGNWVAVWVGRPAGDWFSLPELHTPTAVCGSDALRAVALPAAIVPHPADAPTKAKHCHFHQWRVWILSRAHPCFIWAGAWWFSPLIVKISLTADPISLLWELMLILQVFVLMTISCLFWEAVKANTILNGRVEIWEPLLCCFCFISHLIVQHHLYLICGQMS